MTQAAIDPYKLKLLLGKIAQAEPLLNAMLQAPNDTGLLATQIDAVFKLLAEIKSQIHNNALPPRPRKSALGYLVADSWPPNLATANLLSEISSLYEKL